MKELNDDIDKLFRDSIESDESVPSVRAWSSLEAKLDKQLLEIYKQKVARFRLLSLALLLLLIGVGVYEFTSSKQLSSRKNDMLVNSEKKEVFPEPATATTSASLETPKPHSRNENNVLLSQSIKSVLGKQVRSGDASSRNATASSSLSTAPFASKTVKPVVHETNLPFTSNRTASVNTGVNSSIQPVDAGLTSDSPGMNAAENEPLSAIEPRPVPTKVPETKASTSTSTSATTAATAAATASATTTPANSQTQVLLSTDGPASPDPVKRSRFSMTVFFSPERTSHLLSADHDTDVDRHGDADDDFNKREQPGLSYSAGWKVGYDLGKHWTLFTGASYSASSQKIKPTIIYPEKADKGDLQYSLSTSSGDAQLPDVSGKPLATDSLTLRSFSTQSLQFISVPLIVQYTVTRKKIGFHAYAGFSMNYLVGESLLVEMPSSGSDDHPYTVNSLTGVNRFHAGVVAGVGGQYAITNHLTLMLDPEFIGSITAINYNTPVKSYPYSLGLMLSLGYHF
jgi:hypothetical protein